MSGPLVAPPSGEQLTIERGSVRATVVEVGGGLRRLVVRGLDVIDGFNGDEMAPSGRGQVLVPWPNRIDAGRYAWNGHAQQLPLDEVDAGNAIHGLVRFAGWSVLATSPARVDLAHRLWPSPGYPFLLDLRITYEVTANGLTVTSTARNAGREVAPFGAGQHPYLAPPGGLTVDACTLRVPATRYLESDRRGIPTGEHAVAGSPVDFRDDRPIGLARLDTPFTGLERDHDGRARVWLSGGGRALCVWMDDAYRWTQIFTGDTVPAPRTRSAIAIEPMTCPPNAFVSGVDVIALEPEEMWRGRWGITVVDP
jgi:aldose 1-epimerase